MTVNRVVCIAALFLFVPCALVRAQLAAPPRASQAQLQGSWEGVQIGQAGKYSVAIAGNSLRYEGPKPNEWYETTFTLPAGEYPQQLHATITGCPRKDDIGRKVVAIFKIEDGTLTLAGYDPDSQDSPDPFEDNPNFRYDLKKVEPQRKSTEPPKPK